MPRLEISLLGAFRVTLDGKDILGNFRSNSTRALFAYLAVESSRAHLRTSLADLFWEEAKDPRASLRTSLSNLKQIFASLTKDDDDGCCFLKIDRKSVRLDISYAGCQIDITQFDQHLESTRRHPHNTRNQCPDCIEALEKAVVWYRGRFMTGFNWPGSARFDEWSTSQREYRHQAALQALADISRHLLEVGDYDRAEWYTRQWLHLEHRDEAANRQLIKILHATGDYSGALNHEQWYLDMLQEDIGLEDDEDDEPFWSPAVRSTETPKVTEIRPVPEVESRLVPWEEQTLFGVERLLVTLREQLVQAHRPYILTIAGKGGQGKTSLANRIARSFIDHDRFKQVAWVSAKQYTLQSVYGIVETDYPALNADSLIGKLLEQLHSQHSRDGSSQQRLDTLKKLLKAQPYLVVIDNLETITDYEALLPVLRELSIPSKFLLTSRITLRDQEDIKLVMLQDLAEPDALAFLRHVAQQYRLTAVAEATDEQLGQIYAVVGGNPLALKQIVEKVSTLPLSQVLEAVKRARSQND